MRDEILSYHEMCNLENTNALQKGMNYRFNPNYSVILMSQKNNAPYNDKIFSDGITIEYEGHDIPKTSGIDNPKNFDQQKFTKNNSLTENGKFVQAVEKYKNGMSIAEIVRVYEKIYPGIWSDKGFFILKDYKYIIEHGRQVYKFILQETDYELEGDKIIKDVLKPRTRIIPSNVKKEVWKRDGGKCVLCGSKDELHFDHDVPFSKGGTSIDASNVRILCARHNLAKSDKIE